MTLNDIQVAFIKDASILGDYSLLTKTELANGYCDADEAAIKATEEGNTLLKVKNESLRSAYYSALMLRYWYKIFEWAQNSSNLNLELVDFVNWLSDSFYVAFYYRTWRYADEAIVKHGKFIDWKYDENGNKIPNKYYYKRDMNAPDKIINRCCGSMRGRMYQYLNKDKRKASNQMYSLDSMVEDAGDSALIYGNCYDNNQSTNDIYYLINILISKGESLEALIVDGIANHDSYKQITHTTFVEKEDENGEALKEKVQSVESVFDARKLVKHLNQINQEFISTFCSQYSISQAEAKPLYEELKSLPNVKLYKKIQKTLLEIKNNPELLSCLISM